MVNVGAIITALGTGGTGALVVTVLRGISDERARRRAEKKATATAPLEVKSLELRVAERAGRIAETASEIQHQTMEDLRRAYVELDSRFERYRKDAEDQRERDLREADRMREHDRQELVDARDEIKRLKERIQDQDSLIQRLQFELQQSGSGP